MSSPKKSPPSQPDLPFAKRSTLADSVATLMNAGLPNSSVTSRQSLETAPGSSGSEGGTAATDDRTLLESRFPILRLWR
jgi:hypothetical protein